MSIYFTQGTYLTDTLLQLVLPADLDRVVHISRVSGGSAWVNFGAGSILFGSSSGPRTFVLPAGESLWAKKEGASALIEIMVTSIGR